MSQPMNREQRRMLKKQGQTVDESGQVVEQKDPRAANTGAGSGGRITEKGGVAQKDRKTARKDAAPVAEEKTSPVQFGKEVKSELSKVSWPSRSEVINYSIVVLFTVIVLTLFIGAIDWIFSTFVLELFEPRQ